MDVSRSTLGETGNSTFGYPRTPEKAQLRLGWLQLKKKKNCKDSNTLKSFHELYLVLVKLKDCNASSCMKIEESSSFPESSSSNIDIDNTSDYN